MLECEGIGKNVEQAIENALLELKASRHDVDIKILEQGGLFKKAKVLVKISDEALPKYQRINELKIKEAAAEKKSVQAETAAEQKPAQTIKEKTDYKKETEKVNVQIKTVKTETPKNSFAEKINSKPIKEAGSVKHEKVQIAAVKSLSEEKSALNETTEGKKFLTGLLKVLDIQGEVSAQENDEFISFSVTGEKTGDLIGYRGESLNALQLVLSNAVCKSRNSKKVILDIDGFKEKRKITLEQLARRIASKVEKTKKQVKLEPMVSYERRIIHTIIQEYPQLISFSEGEEPNRYLVVRFSTKGKLSETHEEEI